MVDHRRGLIISSYGQGGRPILAEIEDYTGYRQQVEPSPGILPQVSRSFFVISSVA